MKKRICLLIPDGVGIRNYLYSDVIKYIDEAGHKVVVWHALPEEVIKIAEELHGVTIEAHRFDSYPDPFLIRLYREATTFARLRINAQTKGNKTILTNWNTKRNTWGKKLLFPMAERLGSTLKSYKAVAKLEQRIYALQQKTAAYKIYQGQLKALNIDVLFCTHQRVPHVVSTMIAAQNLGIKTATAIFSWDNLPKARLPFRVDKYLVWSDYMKQELLEYYPEISEKTIAVTGTPQFDFYYKSELIQSREAFAQEHGLYPDKKWVLYSGDDKTTSPFDANYLADVAEQLKNETDLQILFRQVPVENTDRYQAVLNKYEPIIHIPPKWTSGAKWSNFYPEYGDVVLLVNLAKHCAGVINVGSTMALDFSNFNVPALYINYNQAISENWSVKTIYSFQHFRTMENLDPVGWMNSKEEIAYKIRLALEHPEKIGPERKKWFERIAQPHPTKTASERIVEAIVS